MKVEKQQLVHDLLDTESRREITLLAAGNILRRRRQWRVARQTGILTMLIAATLLVVERNRPHQTLVQASPSKTNPSTSLQSRSLTDEQLLSLFPNTPVGIATLSNGKKLFLFPRAADEVRYVKRL